VISESKEEAKKNSQPIEERRKKTLRENYFRVDGPARKIIKIVFMSLDITTAKHVSFFSLNYCKGECRTHMKKPKMEDLSFCCVFRAVHKR
jgi:hypothetical protein